MTEVLHHSDKSALVKLAEGVSILISIEDLTFVLSSDWWVSDSRIRRTSDRRSLGRLLGDRMSINPDLQIRHKNKKPLDFRRSNLQGRNN